MPTPESFLDEHIQSIESKVAATGNLVLASDRDFQVVLFAWQQRKFALLFQQQSKENNELANAIIANNTVTSEAIKQAIAASQNSVEPTNGSKVKETLKKAGPPVAIGVGLGSVIWKALDVLQVVLAR